MSGTKAGGAKARNTNYERARVAGRKGGLISRRGPAKREMY